MLVSTWLIIGDVDFFNDTMTLRVIKQIPLFVESGRAMQGARKKMDEVGRLLGWRRMGSECALHLTDKSGSSERSPD